MKFPYTVIDLTHPLDANTPTWSGGCGFSHETKLDYYDCTTAVKFRVQKIKMHAGIGTHMDAPAHCIPGGKTIDQLALSDLIAPCVVINVADRAHERYRVSVDDITAFEQQYGTIAPRSFVLIATGWQQYWHDASAYRNNYLFPCVSADAAQLLLARNVAGLGIDTLSPDSPDDGYPVHGSLLGAGCYLVENVANALMVPPVGSFIMALPMNIKGGTEAPIRLIALVGRSL